MPTSLENNHHNTEILIQINNELACKIPRKIGEDLIFCSYHTNFSAESRVFRQSHSKKLSPQQTFQPYEAYIHKGTQSVGLEIPNLSNSIAKTLRNGCSINPDMI